jgi:uncharacterized protein
MDEARFLALALKNPINVAILDELHQLAQVGVRRTDGGFDVYAPHGFDDVAGLIARPNPGPNFSAANYAVKAARWRAFWPELTVVAPE